MADNEQKPTRGLFMKRGTLVYDAGPLPPCDVVEWIAEARAERMRAVYSTPAKKKPSTKRLEK